jgi:hypothetical protein
MPTNKNTLNNYIELIKAINNTKIDNNYEPKNYDFNLDSFNNNKKDDKKKRVELSSFY